GNLMPYALTADDLLGSHKQDVYVEASFFSQSLTNFVDGLFQKREDVRPTPISAYHRCPPRRARNQKKSKWACVMRSCCKMFAQARMSDSPTCCARRSK
ncbi:hypothetical protein, partial [Rhizobium leguminosarum]|uniref:hypothetical protein n=1 Tax=Rhizobium leguminosarum TaxID=384 RepID=UPI003F9B0F8B